jgi:hypothetical protein
MLCFVYQLGACPCGCVEHNYWIQMLGMTAPDAEPSHDATHHGADREVACHDGHDHECVGAPARLFVNNSRQVESPRVGQVGWFGCKPDSALMLLGGNYGVASPRSPPDVWLATHSNSELQVFLL